MTKRSSRKPIHGNSITIVRGRDETNEVVRAEAVVLYSWHHFQAAKLFVRESNRTDLSHAELVAYINGSIIMSWCLLEAALQDFVHVRSCSAGSPLSDSAKWIIAKIGQEDLFDKNKNTLEKFNAYLRIIDAQEMPTGNEPYQSAESLRSFRNELVHPRPENVVLADRSGKDTSDHYLVKRLRSDLGLKSDASFPRDVLTPRAAVWALDTAIHFLQEFEKRSGVSIGLKLK